LTIYKKREWGANIAVGVGENPVNHQQGVSGASAWYSSFFIELRLDLTGQKKNNLTGQMEEMTR
jgi:hypothetical protein